MYGFKAPTTAYRTLKGMEVMHALRTGQGHRFAYGQPNPGRGDRREGVRLRLITGRDLSRSAPHGQHAPAAPQPNFATAISADAYTVRHRDSGASGSVSCHVVCWLWKNASSRGWPVTAAARAVSPGCARQAWCWWRSRLRSGTLRSSRRASTCLLGNDSGKDGIHNADIAASKRGKANCGTGLPRGAIPRCLHPRGSCEPGPGMPTGRESDQVPQHRDDR